MSDYRSNAVRALLHAARREHDFAGFLASTLAEVSGQLGSSDALTYGRPGSWEAALVDQLVKGTVGYDDQYLPGPRGKLTDAKAREIRWAYDDGFNGVTEKQVAAEFGVSPSTVSDISTGKTWARLDETR